MDIFAFIYVIILSVNAVVELGLMIYAWQHRGKTAVPSFIGFVFLAFGLSLSSLLTTISLSLPWRHFWQTEIRYLILPFLPVFTLTFVLAYTGRQRWLTWRNQLLIVAIPLAIQFILWFGEPGAVVGDMYFAQHGRYYLLSTYERGPWFWIHTGYSYILLIVSFYLLIQYARQQTQLYQRQSALLLGGMLMPVLANILATADLLSSPHWDWIAISFTLTAVFWGQAFFRFSLLDIMPIARDAVLESMEDPVIVLDLQQHIVDLNPAAQKLIGQPTQEVIGKFASDLFRAIPDLLERYQSGDSTTTEIVVDSQTYDLRISTLLKNSTQPMGQLVVLREITKRKMAEIERERLILELDAYAHTVAHDLKSPLALIIGYSDIALLTPELPESLQEPMSTIMQTSRKMATIVNELLLLGSVRSDKEVELSPLKMGEILPEVMTRLKKQINESQAVIIIPETWPEAIGYAPWVEEIWVNYLNNAIKYGGTPPRIEIGANPVENGKIQFWVQDNGSGLDESEQATIFAPYKRLQRNPKIKGHGLGLSIVERIAAKLNGEVSVTSQPGNGSRFYFSLPGLDTERP